MHIIEEQTNVTTAYRRFGAISESNDISNGSALRNPRKRVSPRLSPPPLNVADEAEENIANKLHPLPYGQQTDSEEDDLEGTSRAGRSTIRAPSHGLQAGFQTPSPPSIRYRDHNPAESIEMDDALDRTPNVSPGPFDDGLELGKGGLEYDRPSKETVQTDPSQNSRGFQRVILDSPALTSSDLEEDSDG